jgi:hypothetical protein
MARDAEKLRQEADRIAADDALQGAAYRLLAFEEKYSANGKWTGGVYDVKRLSRIYEDQGNLMYGNLGKRAGFDDGTLKFFAGVVQNNEERNLVQRRFDPRWGDLPRDAYHVNLGIRAYELGIDPW